MSVRTLCICNAFSCNMLQGDHHVVEFVQLTPESLAREIESAECIKSYIGHADTARLYSKLLGVDVTYNRENLHLPKDWCKQAYLIVGQYSGPRLPEGATELPEGATITWWLVEG